MSGKKWVGKSGFLFSTQTSEMHILAVIYTLRQHKFCVNKGKKKTKLPITCENFVFLCLFCFVNILFTKCGKNTAGGLERIRRVTVNTTFFRLIKICIFRHLYVHSCQFCCTDFPLNFTCATKYRKIRRIFIFAL